MIVSMLCKIQLCTRVLIMLNFLIPTFDFQSYKLGYFSQLDNLPIEIFSLINSLFLQILFPNLIFEISDKINIILKFKIFKYSPSDVLKIKIYHRILQSHSVSLYLVSQICLLLHFSLVCQQNFLQIEYA